MAIKTEYEFTFDESIRFSRNGFNRPFGTYTIRQCEICVVIATHFDTWNMWYQVYLTHGTPGGAFWRNGKPLGSFNTEAEARELAETLYGITGSGKLATVVEW